MRVAYADPPYPGNAESHYGKHADYDGEVDHVELIARLEAEFPDGWALSTGAKNLQTILGLCPPVRTLIWRKLPGTPLGDHFNWTFEPVFLRGCRRPSQHVPDVHESMPPGFWFSHKPKTFVTGAKPPPFCRWLFTCMGLGPNDELVDIFPGSGAVQSEWEAFRAQGVLAA